MKKIFLLLLFSLFLTGCKNGFWPFGSSWFSSIENAGFEFATDNDAVFDLFQDDFGTGTQYDDSLTNDGSLDFDMDDAIINDPVAYDTGEPVSTTIDQEYDKIARMTQDELRVVGTIKIPVLFYAGNQFPFPEKQFGSLYDPDRCDHSHYHGSSGWTLDLKYIPETDPACGFDNNVQIIEVTGKQMIDWFLERPRNF